MKIKKEKNSSPEFRLRFNLKLGEELKKKKRSSPEFGLGFGLNAGQDQKRITTLLRSFTESI